MKNITEILAGLEITIPEDKAAAFKKEFADNYKTIADYIKQKDDAKLAYDGLQEQLDDVQTKLKAFEGVDPENLKGEITRLSGELTTAQEAHAKELSKITRQSETKDFLGAYKFINAETRDYYMSKLDSALEDDANKGKSRKDILDSLVNDEDGKPRANIFEPNKHVPPPPYAPGTGSAQMLGGTEAGTSLRDIDKSINSHRLIK